MRKLLTGEPYAGKPPVRFGGRGDCISPTPIWRIKDKKDKIELEETAVGGIILSKIGSVVTAGFAALTCLAYVYKKTSTTTVICGSITIGLGYFSYNLNRLSKNLYRLVEDSEKLQKYLGLISYRKDKEQIVTDLTKELEPGTFLYHWWVKETAVGIVNRDFRGSC